MNDEHALAALPALEAGGWKMEGERSAVSFDDTSDIARHHPPLTSIAVPRFEIGRWAVRVLVDHLRHPDIRSANIVLRTRLRVRGA